MLLFLAGSVHVIRAVLYQDGREGVVQNRITIARCQRVRFFSVYRFAAIFIFARISSIIKRLTESM